MSRPAYSTSVYLESQGALMKTDTVFGANTIGIASSEVKVGASALSGRNAVMIQADDNNADAIYLGVNSAPTVSNAMIKLSAGSVIVLNFDKYNVVPLYAISGTANQKIYVTEVK